MLSRFQNLSPLPTSVIFLPSLFFSPGAVGTFSRSLWTGSGEAGLPLSGSLHDTAALLNEDMVLRGQEAWGETLLPSSQIPKIQDAVSRHQRQTEARAVPFMRRVGGNGAA